MEIQERLNIDELKNIEQLINKLLMAWRQLNKDYRALQLQYDELLSTHQLMQKDHAFSVEQLEQQWSDKNQQLTDELKQEKNQFLEELKIEKENLIRQYENQIVDLQEKLGISNQHRDAMIARIRGMKHE